MNGPRSALSRRSLWITAIALIVLIATTVSLGNWQMRRADEKRRLAVELQQAMDAAPIEIGAQDVDPGTIDGRLIRVRGQFDVAGTVFLDNRTHQGRAGFHVLTPLVPQSGGVPLMVLRGWVERASADPRQVPSIVTPTQTVEIAGLAVVRLPQAMQLATPRTPERGQRIWQFFDLEMYSQWSSSRVRPFVLRQTSPLDDRLIREWVQPGASIDKNLTYALQWYSMAAALVCFGLVSIWRISRRRTDTVIIKDRS